MENIFLIWFAPRSLILELDTSRVCTPEQSIDFAWEIQNAIYLAISSRHGYHISEMISQNNNNFLYNITEIVIGSVVLDSWTKFLDVSILDLTMRLGVWIAVLIGQANNTVYPVQTAAGTVSLRASCQKFRTPVNFRQMSKLFWYAIYRSIVAFCRKMSAFHLIFIEFC